MFVRWKRRERASGRWCIDRGAGKFLLTAALVCSERRGGKPRQRVLATLGSIGDEGVRSVGKRLSFWRAADSRLASLGLAPDRRRRVEEALHAVCPSPTAEEERELGEHMARLLGALTNPRDGQA